jgi:transcriptional regulator with XRE-family HTH domain
MTVQPEKLATVFGSNVRSFRIALGLSQQDLALKLGEGVGQGYVSRVESGKTAPTLRTVALFSEALGVEPNVLVSELPAPIPAV